ncbi:hypothetical protein A2997_02340 [Candidatus Nomurabacteria bacterium RIFCSPLOWO2_01_FULL_36_10b]|uniref:Pseudouridine synthase n=1 Tax=Candidatus Nomurabacteria bacterium RIFCSPLOWO2_01_FULL_36_10b TaxID=1801766 RepID=A0A1F6WP15_9BACT|nr:MAG: hypothetical protein A2997_02340 [Candidatus Nomurabacteria bacterium RIFCSPLOWO2_01_FULL_36_10b]
MSQSNIQIIHECSDYIVINKPAGLVVHSDGRTKEPTLVDWILKHYPEIDGVGEDWSREDDMNVNVKKIVKRCGIVHRLDRDTSGAMVIARTQTFFDFIKKQFQEHTVEKTYHAIVYGKVKQDSGVINASIGKSPSDFRRWSAQRGARGVMRQAVTHYCVLGRYSFLAEGEEIKEYTYIEFRPETGRTHQIRVHAKYMNHPIVADTLYAGSISKNNGNNVGFTHQALHAFALSFFDIKGVKHEYKAPIPDDFKHALAILRSI